MFGKSKEFVKGYIVVEINGLNPEKFINMAARSDIVMWDITRIDITTMEFKMHQTQFKGIKNIASKTKCSVRIKKKFGFSFVMNKFKRRKLFTIGLVIFFAMLIYFSSMVWIIDIKGNKNIDTIKIYNSLEKAGLKKGVYKRQVKVRDIEKHVMNEIDEIAVINVKFIGTLARVEVVERKMPPKKIPLTSPCDIVAKKEGIIIKALAYKGRTLVKVGDFVKKDDLLISAQILDNENNQIDLVHSMGEVIAQTWYEEKQEINLDYKYYERTGNLSKKVYYVIGNKKICVKNDRIEFKKYDRIEETSKLKINGKETPFEKIEEYFFEKVERSKKLSVEEALNLGVKQAEDRIKGIITADINIIDKKIEKTIESGKISVRVLYIAEEDIGMQKEVSINHN